MTEKLMEPEGWLANAILKCLYKWKERSDPAPFMLTGEDLDSLTKWAETLRLSWIETRDYMNRNGIEIEIYPVKVSGGSDG